MNWSFPSVEFDEATAAVCHGQISVVQAEALNALLRRDLAARDEYLLRVELHSRLATVAELFVREDGNSSWNVAELNSVLSPNLRQHPASAGTLKRRNMGALTLSALALAACVALVLGVMWLLQMRRHVEVRGEVSKAVALLNRVVDPVWAPLAGEVTPQPGSPLEPGWLRLKSGLAQIVFYSGARLVIEGPAEIQLVSPDKAVGRVGRMIAEVPPQARGFYFSTPQIEVTELGSIFGVSIKDHQTELHAFKGNLEYKPFGSLAKHSLKEGAGALAERAQPPQSIVANSGPFFSLFNLQQKSSNAEILRHEQWQAASRQLDEDPTLLIHFDFEPNETLDWRLPNTCRRKDSQADAHADATIVGCQWVEGRLPEKRALEFRNGSDRVRMSVPGEYESLTLVAWVCVQGLDRQINSLFMSDGFKPGTLHWSIRRDGVLGLTVIGSEQGQFQICRSPPVLTLDQFGFWLQLAVVIDGETKRVVHYLDGLPVGEKELKIAPPFRIGVAELGNWNAHGFPKQDPFMIRNFSGAMDEFCLFRRALGADEIQELYSLGQPQSVPLQKGRN